MRGTGNRAARKRRGSKDDEKQSQRFVETARALEADESPKSFERVFERVVRSKKKTDTS
jgi:hypothetical protein